MTVEQLREQYDPPALLVKAEGRGRQTCPKCGGAGSFEFPTIGLEVQCRPCRWRGTVAK